MHAEELLAEKNPAAHAAQPVLLEAEKKPAGHTAQSVAALMLLKAPAQQEGQVFIPLCGAKAPGAHGRQPTQPLPAAYEPGEQRVQLASPADAVKDPAPHAYTGTVTMSTYCDSDACVASGTWQLATELLPVFGLKVPATHAVHPARLAAPAIVPYVPLGQLVQKESELAPTVVE
jgi:hypothetical protein